MVTGKKSKNMVEEEQLIAIFRNGICLVTGNSELAERVGKQMVKMKGKLGVISLALWSLIISIWLIRTVN